MVLYLSPGIMGEVREGMSDISATIYSDWESKEEKQRGGVGTYAEGFRIGRIA